jgi:hypothetical protein
MRVDFPAPFSPQIAWMWPRSTVSETSSKARTPGKTLVIDRISRILLLTLIPPLVVKLFEN